MDPKLTEALERLAAATDEMNFFLNNEVQTLHPEWTMHFALLEADLVSCAIEVTETFGQLRALHN